MRPPILKAWHRTTIDYRGIYVNRYGIGAQGGDSGEVILPEGDNYVFTFNGDEYRFELKTQGGVQCALDIVGDAGLEQLHLVRTVNPPIVGLVPNVSGFAPLYYQFTADNYFRLLNTDTFLHWHTISALLDENHTISERFASNAAVSTDANTYNALFKFVSGTLSFYLRYIPTGALFKPWVIDLGSDVYQLQLTAA